MGEGSRCPFPSVCGRPPPGDWGSLCRPAWRGPGAGRGPQQLEGARAGRAGAAARGSLTDYSAAERSLPNPPLCPGPQPRARSDKLLSRRLPVRAKKRRRSRADAKSPAWARGRPGLGCRLVGEGLLSAAAPGLPLSGCIPSGAPARLGEPGLSWALASYADRCCRWSGGGRGADPCFLGSTLEPGERRLNVGWKAWELHGALSGVPFSLAQAGGIPTAQWPRQGGLSWWRACHLTGVFISHHLSGQHKLSGLS